MVRAHFNRLMLDTTLAVPTTMQVRVLQNPVDTIVNDRIYDTVGDETERPNPFTVTDGYIDFYLDKPQRVRLGISIEGGPERIYPAVDVVIPAENLSRVATTGKYADLDGNPTKDDVGLGAVNNTSDASKPVSTAQRAAIMAALNAAAPVGRILPYAGANPPANELFCFGQAVSRIDYAALYAVIGLTYTPSGTDAALFCVPDLRSRYLMGAGGQTPSALGANEGQVGSGTQPEVNRLALLDHTHNHTATTSSDSHNHSGTTSSNGGHNHGTGGPSSNQSNLSGNGTQTAANDGHTHTTTTVAGHTHTFTTTTDAHTHTVSIANKVGLASVANTMHAYLALNMLIRFANPSV